MYHKKTSIAFVIESLGSGGAERQLIELVKNLNKEQYLIRVMTFTPSDFYLPELQDSNTPTIILNRRGRWDLKPVLKLVQWLKSGEVDIVHSYLNTANLYAVLAGKIAKRGMIIVSERCSEKHYTRLQAFYRYWAYSHADVIIANSQAARKELISRNNLHGKDVLFISNAIDMNKFIPIDSDTRLLLRQKLRWSLNKRIVLTVASFKYQKNHLGMVNAIAGLDLVETAFNFCWAGSQTPRQIFMDVKQRIDDLNLDRIIHFLPPQENVIDLYHACDILLLNSLWEGTPNVVLEAMACGCPVIATDVGDVGRYVIPGVTGWLIPPNDPKALRDALESASRLSEQELRAMGASGRQHLLHLKMASSDMAHCYENVYARLQFNKYSAKSSSIE